MIFAPSAASAIHSAPRPAPTSDTGHLLRGRNAAKAAWLAACSTAGMRHRLAVLVALPLSTLAACVGPAPETAPSQTAPVESGKAKAPRTPHPAAGETPLSETAELDATMAEVLAKTPAVPGASVAIVRDGAVVLAKGYGKARVSPEAPMTRDSILNVASISKAITAVVALKAVEGGKLSLDGDIGTALGFSLRNPKFPDVPLTLRMLLMHTTSIDSRTEALSAPLESGWVEDADSSLSLKELVEETFTPGRKWYDASLYSAKKPGTAYDYCNICPAITAYAIERVTGEAFDAYSKEVLFDPAQMTSTTWRLADTDRARLVQAYTLARNELSPAAPQGAPYYPADSLRTTPADLGKLIVELTRTHAVLSADLAEQMFTVHDDTVAKGQALALSANEPGVFGHSGSDLGVVSDMLFDTSTNTGIVVVLNGDGGERGDVPIPEIEAALWKAAKGQR
ncbi:MAG: serine hydrolase domain-containing protein [Labilithrix sp.]